MILVDGREIAQEIENQLRKKIAKSSLGRPPGLAILLVGEREDSCLYVKIKRKRAENVGIETHLYRFGKNCSEGEILEVIEYLNQDEEIDAILVQLPLPTKFDTDKIISFVSPQKDADRFQVQNMERFLQEVAQRGENLPFQEILTPPVFGAIGTILQETKYDLLNKEVAILANSKVFGNNLKEFFKNLGAQRVRSFFDKSDLRKKLGQADLVVSAVGIPRLIKGALIKKGAFLIDVGISKKGKRVWGDIDQASVSSKASFLTPVPGGIGPLTVAELLKNTFLLALLNQKKAKNKS